MFKTMGISERKEREKERRKNDIIDAAENIFFEKGFDTATMDDVANEAELSKGTLYLYFRNKEELHFSIIVRGIKILSEIFNKSISQNKPANENLLEIGKAYVQFSQKHNNYFKAIMQFHSSKIDKISDEQKQIIFQPESPLMFFINILEKGKEDGTIRSDIPTNELAILLWSQTSGAMEFIVLRQEMLNMFDINIEDMIMNNFKILLDGVNN